MNLISIEEHFFFTGVKTGKGEYFDLLNKTREIRKELLKKVVKETEGENYCIQKHLLAASMRLIEVGIKSYSEGKKQEAEDLFSKAYDLWSLFWGINLKLIDIGQVKKIDENQYEVLDENGSIKGKIFVEKMRNSDKFLVTFIVDPKIKKQRLQNILEVIKDGLYAQSSNELNTLVPLFMVAASVRVPSPVFHSFLGISSENTNGQYQAFGINDGIQNSWVEGPIYIFESKKIACVQKEREEIEERLTKSWSDFLENFMSNYDKSDVEGE